MGVSVDIGAYEYNDTVSPTINFSCSPTSVKPGGTITCSCSATDDVDSSPSVSYTVNPSTSSTGTFTTKCTAEDDFENSAISSISYTVSSTGGGGYPTYKPTQEQIQLEEGYEKTLRKNWKIMFEFDNENHTISLDDIINETAIITVSSQNQTFNLTINEAEKLNLNDDGYYDLEILLKDISDYEADLSIKLIREEIPEEDEEPDIDEKIEMREKIKDVMNRFIKSYWLWVVVALIIVIIIITIVLIIRYKRRYSMVSPQTIKSPEERLL